MTRLFKKHYHPAGTAPGTLRELSLEQAQRLGPARYTLVRRDAGRWGEVREINPAEIPEVSSGGPLCWVHVQGMPTAEDLVLLGSRVGLHPLAQEDVLNGGQRPKVERFDESLVIILGIPEFDAEGTLHLYQLTLLMGTNVVVSLMANSLDPFVEVRRRLEERGGRMLGEPDDLLYGLLDAAVDHAFPVLDSLGEQIEELEVEILDRPDSSTLERLHGLKRELIMLRRYLWPTREVINQLLRDHDDLFTPDTLMWMRDVYDHTVQVMDLVESYRDMIASLLDVYLSSMSHRLNESMRTLTIIATVFMPLTFIVGVYGMNFAHPTSPFAMPELGWYWGYPLVWGAMIATAIAMVIWFKRKRWF
ncbi:magnesium/cobalt transporter CorA [Billgrantia kenyensis]|uniref:Magnesium transport protein CorA n=1 Tax=Billgrantia kenyensis TaxID=321266 RepID=A0A7V9VYI5_9GAMM|nr:magnesium/cobalt transporter CorA [Halomonas kenyensis]MBA2777742.1 magnesium/cobalt transporter CorA [Halomonas kenyensis]MCG6660412.1 magnesium/cobalt transporter CorA [Halomonas kenyensis]